MLVVVGDAVVNAVALEPGPLGSSEVAAEPDVVADVVDGDSATMLVLCVGWDPGKLLLTSRKAPGLGVGCGLELPEL